MPRPLPILLLAATLLGAAPRQQVEVFMIGDSTMADKPTPERNPERGWGQMLPPHFGPGVVVRNHAANGRSTKRFLDEGKWDTVLAALGPGDYVFIQFGHNDGHQTDSVRHANPYTAYRRNLERFVTETRAKGATPVLLSPIVRRYFNAHGVLTDAHGPYPFVMREVARELEVPFVDLQLMTEDLVLGLGPERSKALYLWLEPGESEMYPEGKQDNTHLTVRGATEVARLAAEGLRGTKLPLAAHLKTPE